jgi:transposase
MKINEPALRRSKNSHNAISVRQEEVRLVESGLSQQAVRQQFGVGHMTLLAWLQRYGTAVYAQMRRKQFTAAQKQHIARELLDGRLSEDEALLKYELRLKKTLRQWVAAYRASESRLLSTEPDPPADASGPLAAQLRQAQWQIEALHTLIEQAEAAYKIDIRKKAGAKPSN